MTTADYAEAIRSMDADQFAFFLNFITLSPKVATMTLHTSERFEHQPTYAVYCEALRRGTTTRWARKARIGMAVSV